MLPLRHKIAIVCMVMSLIGVLTVSYFQIVDMDSILVEEAKCHNECNFRIAQRCLVCRDTDKENKSRTRRSIANEPSYHQHNNINQILMSGSKDNNLPQYVRPVGKVGVTGSAVTNSNCEVLTVCLHHCPDQGIVNVCKDKPKQQQQELAVDARVDSDTVLYTDEEPLCEEDRPLVMGHAGGDVVNSCENTYQATRLGIEEGMDSVHIDISISKDGVPFLWRDHDPRSLSSRLRQLGISGIMGCKPAMVPETLKPAHTLDWKNIQTSWYYLNTTTELPADHVISFKEWISELGPYIKTLASIWLEFRMPKYLLQSSLKAVWKTAVEANIQDKLFFKIKENGKISFHHPITLVGGVDISIDQLSAKQWNALVYILEEVQTADPQDNVFILNREDEVIYALLVEKVTSKPSFLTEEIKSLVDPNHLNLNGINFEVKTMDDLVENVKKVISSRDSVTRDSCQPHYTQVAAWTVNNMETCSELVCARIDYIITDYPGRVNKYVDCSKYDDKEKKKPPIDCPMFCARIYDPVCGSDGKTHSNECMLRLTACESGYRVETLYPGRCRVETEQYSRDGMERSAAKISNAYQSDTANGISSKSKTLKRKCDTTVTTPSQWFEALKAILNGTSDGQSICADEDLMVSVEEGVDPLPDTLSGSGRFWSWCSGNDALDLYLDFAKDAMNSGGGVNELTIRIMNWVGIPNDGTLDPEKTYQLAVFSKKTADTVGPFSIFQPTWQNWFKYLERFTPCSFANGMNTCFAPISIKFTDQVQIALESLNVSQVTECQSNLNCKDNTCLPDFCQMEAILQEIIDDVGYFTAARFFANGERTAAEARAFFYTIFDCTWLFTGNGYSNNGVQDTSKEYIVRGDIPLKMMAGQTYILKSPSKKQIGNKSTVIKNPQTKDDDFNNLLMQLDLSLLCDASFCQADQKYNPVCGTDGFTYDNACFLAQTRCGGKPVELYKPGACHPDACQANCGRQKNPVCGTDRQSYNSLCSLKKSSCLAKQKNLQINVWHNGKCGDCNMICTREFSPVCGSDGQTYASQCELESETCKKGIPVWKVSDGICSASASGKQGVKIIFEKDDGVLT